MLDLPHVARLAAYVAELRHHGFPQVPDFDPLDGGVEARTLFLFEKPGPMAVKSGFISRNNDDPTAEATFKFMEQAGIPRKLTVIWNVIPWWNGTCNVTRPELHQGVECVQELVKLLPRLCTVVMVGRNAARARKHLESLNVVLIESYHPSPVVRATSRAKWEAIPFQWAEVMTTIESHQCARRSLA
jgi:Uracil DNA glycosylase superfamily